MSDRPNIVFLVLDTLRQDRVSLYNDDVNFTENLDALGSESLVFTDAVAQAPWTLPSHASMFTGTYPWKHGATQQSPTFESTDATLVERFADAGYRTGGFSPNPWVSPFCGLATGFDIWDDFLTPRRLPVSKFVASSVILKWWSNRRLERLKGVITDVADSLFEIWSRYQGADTAQSQRVVERGKAFLKDVDRSQPFFLYMNLLDAHEPYYPPEPYRERHAPGVDPHEECQIPSRYLKGEAKADFENLGRLYDASVDHLDDVVGSFIEFLRRTDRLDDTILIVLSDHGQALGESELYGHQYGCGPELTEVPLVVRVPGTPPDTVDDLVELRELFDLVPALAGVGPEYTPGVPVAKGGYGFPDLAIRQLPAALRDEYYKRFRFAVNEDQHVVRSESESERAVATSAVRRATGKETEPDRTLVRSLPDDGDAERESVDFADPVENRLEELGYL